jgi:hypothetical protein
MPAAREAAITTWDTYKTERYTKMKSALGVCARRSLLMLAGSFPTSRFEATARSARLAPRRGWAGWSKSGTGIYQFLKSPNRGSGQFSLQASWLMREPWSQGNGPASANAFMFFAQVRYNLP